MRGGERESGRMGEREGGKEIKRWREICLATLLHWLCYPYYRRVHITQATLDALNGAYDVETLVERPVNRYLDEHGMLVTFFIVSRCIDIPTIVCDSATAVS